jgi:hypothetical protein
MIMTLENTMMYLTTEALLLERGKTRGELALRRTI